MKTILNFIRSVFFIIKSMEIMTSNFIAMMDKAIGSDMIYMIQISGENKIYINELGRY